MLAYEEHGLGLFDSSLCCDEMFPQTIIANSPNMENIWRGPQKEDNTPARRLIDWERGFPWAWRAGDFETLRDSECLFARKFDAGVDAEIIKLVAGLARG